MIDNTEGQSLSNFHENLTRQAKIELSHNFNYKTNFRTYIIYFLIYLGLRPCYIMQVI